MSGVGGFGASTLGAPSLSSRPRLLTSIFTLNEFYSYLRPYFVKIDRFVVKSGQSVCSRVHEQRGAMTASNLARVSSLQSAASLNRSNSLSKLKRVNSLSLYGEFMELRPGGKLRGRLRGSSSRPAPGAVAIPRCCFCCRGLDVTCKLVCFPKPRKMRATRRRRFALRRPRGRRSREADLVGTSSDRPLWIHY